MPPESHWTHVFGFTDQKTLNDAMCVQPGTRVKLTPLGKDGGLDTPVEFVVAEVTCRHGVRSLTDRRGTTYIVDDRWILNVIEPPLPTREGTVLRSKAVADRIAVREDGLWRIYDRTVDYGRTLTPDSWKVVK